MGGFMEKAKFDIMSHPAVIGLRDNDIPFTVIGNTAVISGFAGFGNVRLTINDYEELYMRSETSGVDLIESYTDIIDEAYDWYKKEYQKGTARHVPEIWKKFWLDMGLITEITTVHYQPAK